MSKSSIEIYTRGRRIIALAFVLVAAPLLFLIVMVVVAVTGVGIVVGGSEHSWRPHARDSGRNPCDGVRGPSGQYRLQNVFWFL